jgi:ubiquinone/menaquinone biosynthesis C-methylase UbiE
MRPRGQPNAILSRGSAVAAVVLAGVLEHVADCDALFAECCRVAAPGVTKLTRAFRRSPCHILVYKENHYRRNKYS